VRALCGVNSFFGRRYVVVMLFLNCLNVVEHIAILYLHTVSIESVSACLWTLNCTIDDRLHFSQYCTRERFAHCWFRTASAKATVT